VRELLHAKIHRATVTHVEPDYIGSIGIDRTLLEKADIWAGEKVLVSDLNNGARFETYVVEEEADSGIIAVNGAAAHLVRKGDEVIIMAFELSKFPLKAKIVLVDDRNRFVKYL
jgi:aspartate 1-decarboxylase